MDTQNFAKEVDFILSVLTHEMQTHTHTNNKMGGDSFIGYYFKIIKEDKTIIFLKLPKNINEEEIIPNTLYGSLSPCSISDKHRNKKFGAISIVNFDVKMYSKTQWKYYTHWVTIISRMQGYLDIQKPHNIAH